MVPALLMGLVFREVVLKIIKEMEFQERQDEIWQSTWPDKCTNEQPLLSPHPLSPTGVSLHTTLVLRFPHL